MNRKFWFYLLRQTHKLSNQQLIKLIEQNISEKDLPLSVADIKEYVTFTSRQEYNFSLKYHELLNKQEELFLLYKNDFFIMIDEKCYPKLLKNIYNPPAMIFYRGDLNLLKTRCIAFIGSRKANEEIIEMLDVLLPEIIKQQFTIVSGLAYGIDTWSHQRTIFHRGKTIAVVGNGLDYFYPYTNKRLQEVIANKHLLLSEYPIFTKPQKFHFPDRNRIIAGLCEGVCIMQAGRKSGTEITANIALEEGREVFAVPNFPLKTSFAGCNFLIQEGAKLVTTADDILMTLNEWKTL